MQAYIGDTARTCIAGSLKNTSTVISFAGCNFNCPFCFNHQINTFSHEFLLDIIDIKRSIDTSKKELIITGGEPTLQPSSVYEITKFAQENHISVTLETNGSKPEAVRSLIRAGTIDRFIVDIKSPFDPELFSRITRAETFFVSAARIIAKINETLETLRQSKVLFEIRTTVVPSLLFRKEDLFRIADDISMYNTTWILNPFSRKNAYARFKDVNAPSEAFMHTLHKNCAVHYPNIDIILNKEMF